MLGNSTMDEIETPERIDPTRRLLLGSAAMTMVGLNLGAAGASGRLRRRARCRSRSSRSTPAC